MSRFSKIKNAMRCGEVKKSNRDGKKIMKKVCADEKEKLVHAGATGYKHNYSPEAKKNFRARHKCDEKKSPFSAQKVACDHLWPKGQKADGKKKK
jgi:hypothetical protein